MDPQSKGEKPPAMSSRTTTDNNNLTPYRTQTPCDGCDKLRNCINGRWCPELRIYVEHVHPEQGKPCEQQRAMGGGV